MKRLLIALAVVLPLASTPSYATHGDRWSCDMHWMKSVKQRERLIRCEYERIKPPGKRSAVLANFRCESGSDYMDVYAADGYGGPGQQATVYWKGRRNHYRRPSDKHVVGPVTHFRSNVIISMRMAKSAGSWRGHWPTCSRRVGLP